jgi:alkanesulfonate monooxygenase SsuD/methylene tetrahydromethanopterin reductase-like flavin-dependent oxidoreductase (luciferase family)
MVLVGTAGRRGLGIAGSCANGIVLPQGTTPDAVRWARGITTPLDPFTYTAVYTWLSMGDDAARTSARLRPELERWHMIARYPELFRHAPLPGGDARALPENAFDEAVEAMAITGDAVACHDAVRRWGDAGADSVVVRPLLEDGMRDLERFAEEVLPMLPVPSG